MEGDVDRPGTVRLRTRDGTATAGSDYEALDTILHFVPGMTSTNVAITLLNAADAEIVETFDVFLSDPTNGLTLDTPAAIQVAITGSTVVDNDFGFSISFPPESDGAFYENWPEALVEVFAIRDSGETNLVSVDFLTEEGTATSGLDYTPTAGTLVFGPGETHKTIRIPLLNDGLDEPNETFRLVLTNAVGLPIQSPTARSLVVLDNEIGYHFQLQGKGAQFHFTEQQGPVPVPVLRNGDFDFPSSVTYQIYAASYDRNIAVATAGRDFVAASGTLTFAAGETNKAIMLELLDDAEPEPPEGLTIVLSSPTDGVPIARAERGVVISDPDYNPLPIDLGFQPPIVFQPGPEAPGSKLCVLPDGRIILVVVAAPFWQFTAQEGDAVVRLSPEGVPDPTFRRVQVKSGATAIAVHTNGQVYIGGSLNQSLNAIPTPFLARVNDDGSVDRSYSPRLPPDPGTVTALAVQPNGQLLVALTSGLLVRLHPDGSPDLSFQFELQQGAIRKIQAVRDGGCLVFGEIPSRYDEPPFPFFSLLRPDGSTDEAFHSNAPPFSALQAQADGKLITFFAYTSTLGRVLPDGKLDPSFVPFQQPGIFSFMPAADGKILVFSAYSTHKVTRLNSDGTVDDSFLPGSYDLGIRRAHGPQHAVAPLPNGDCLVYGDFWTINGQRAPGLARLLLGFSTPVVIVNGKAAELVETNGPGVVRFSRGGDPSLPLTLQWATAGGSAIPGLDYISASGTLSFAPTETEQTLSIQLFDRTGPQPDRTIHFLLSLPDGTPLPPTAVTVVGNDLGFVPGDAYFTPEGGFVFTLSGYRSHSHVRPQRSTDLFHWSDIHFLSDPQGFDPPGPPPVTRRFYRVVHD
jgi:hypothetical protein